MARRTIYRLRDMKEAITNIRNLLDGVTLDQMFRDVVVRAAFERFPEIASEASRHIPDELKLQYGPTLPWRNIADLGNILRLS